MFQTHPAKGKRILEPIPFMADLVPGAFCHHESWDGNGYPQALMGESIPLIGRIVATRNIATTMTPKMTAFDSTDDRRSSVARSRLPKYSTIPSTNAVMPPR